MTEIVILSHITPLGYSQNSEDAGSCGKLLPGFQAKVIYSLCFLAFFLQYSGSFRSSRIIKHL